MKILESLVSSNLLLDAAKYYYSYYPIKEEDSILKARIAAFSTSVDFLKTGFYEFGVDYIFEAQKYNDAIKQHIFCIYYFNSLFNELKKSYNNLVEDIKSKTQKIDLDILYLKKIALQKALSNEYEFSKSLVINNFKDSGLKNYFNFLDFKTKSILTNSDMIRSKDSMLHLDLLENNEIIPNELNLILEETYYTSLLFSNDIYNLLYNEEPFKFIVFYQTKDSQDFEILKTDGQITFIFEFNSFEYINKIRIDSASSFPFLIKNSDLKFFNQNTKSYESIIFSSEELQENINLYFETVKTNKIKITLIQTKWIEERSLNNGIYGKIFDYSIDRIQFFHSSYKPFGVFRSNELMSLNMPLNLEFNCDYFYIDEDCYNEYYLEFMLYGDSDFDSFNYIKQTENTILKQTPRFNGIVPYPREFGLQKELLVFNSYISKVLFIPNLTYGNNLNVYRKKSKSTTPTLLTLGTDYQISHNGGESFYSVISDSFINDSNGIAGSYCIKLLIENDPIKIKEFTESEYYVTYTLLDLFFLNEDRSIWFYKNKIVFNSKLQDSVGYVRPIILFRTKDYTFDSTSFISTIKLVCEEKEFNKDSYIELIDFVEYISEGDGNVVV